MSTTFVSLIRRLVDRNPMYEFGGDDEYTEQFCFFCDADGVCDHEWEGPDEDAFYAVHAPGCPWMEAALLIGGFDPGKHRPETTEETTQRVAALFDFPQHADPPSLTLVTDNTEGTDG